MTEPIATTTAGQVRGVRLGEVTRFLGVPYAAPPIGELRFALPTPPGPWVGVRDATQPAATAPQRVREFPGIDVAPLVGKGDRGGDDYLNLAIWTPDVAAKGLPVMVFIHGGSFVIGGGDLAVQDGTAFARSGVVLMAMNYRMGIDGFLPIPGVPTNLGLRDQITALAWIKANAAAFGGDPDNITVFGESAGAMSIADLVSSPLAQGLFQKAIIQSGHGSMVRSVAVARRLVDKLAKTLGVTPDLAGFRSTTPEQCLDAIDKAQQPGYRINLRDSDGRNPTFGLSKFIPIYGDDVLPEPPLKALAKGAGADIKVLIGANAEEMNLYFVPNGVREKANRFLAWMLMRGSMPKAWAALKAYGLGQNGQKDGYVMGRTMTDLVFRYPTRQFAAAHHGQTHVYDFAWHSPACNGQLGACHAMEMPFVFNTLANCTGPQGLVGEAPPQELADSIHGVWAGFAKTGTLPWPEYKDESRQVYSLTEGRAAAEPEMPAARFV